MINCPDNNYGDDLTRTCVPSCPTQPVYFAYDPTHRCYKDCLYPYFGEMNISRCVLSCYWGEYRNMTTHRCELCPSSCTSCVSMFGCTNCISDYYLFNGTCLTGCKIGSSPCVSECPTNKLTGTITYASDVSISCV